MKSMFTIGAFACATLLVAATPSVFAQSATSAAGESAAACPHGIDAAKCPFCDPSRIERLGMCKEHSTPEALCVKCKPYLKAAFIASGDWCTEHETPESQCLLCNPDLAKEKAARGQGVGAELRWQREPSLTCSTSSTTVTLASPEVVRTVGFEYVQVAAAPLTRSVERNAEVAYNANKYARLSSRAGGVIAEVKADLGQSVKKGDVLVVVDSTDLGGAKSDLLQAKETAKLWETNAVRERALVEKGIGVEREALEAETKAAEGRIALSRSRQRLQTLGLSKEQIEKVESNGDTSTLLELVASFDGMVVDRAAVMGEVVEPGKPLLAVADTGVVWAMADLVEADLSVVKVGQVAVLTVDGLPGRTFPGRLTWISTQLDPKSRTVKARIELDNGGGLLRANMFGHVRIDAGSTQQAVTVPKDSVQWEGCCNVAFVRSDEAGTTFKPVRLALGYDAGDRYEIADGLKPGEFIVTRGSYILKNEILKNSVGAGCCEIDHLKK